MKITNKFKIIYGYIVLFMLFISTIIPYHKISHLEKYDINNPGYTYEYKSIFNTIPNNIIIIIIMFIISYIIIHNNKIYKKKNKKKPIKPKWILINTIILCLEASKIEASLYINQTWCGINTWCGQIGTTITRFIGFYLYIIGLILLFIYWIIIKKYMSNKD